MKQNGARDQHAAAPAGTSWAPILGKWQIEEHSISFLGGDERFAAHGELFPIGLVINNLHLKSGRCEVVVRFSKVQPDHFAGGMVFGYRSQDRYYVQVQLGAAQAAYCVSEFVPGFGWNPLKFAGPRDSLAAERDYHLAVSIRGQELRVEVDGVQVIELLLPRPIEGKQTGLIAAGSHKVEFSRFKLDADKPKAFVAMEYREPYDTFYREVIKPQAAKFYEVVKIDEKPGPGVIFQDMQREIAQADILIAEITPANPNVFYELGYAHALGKPTVLLAQRNGTLPFDIRSYRVVFYDDSIGGKSRVEADLARHLESIAQSDG